MISLQRVRRSHRLAVIWMSFSFFATVGAFVIPTSNTIFHASPTTTTAQLSKDWPSRVRFFSTTSRSSTATGGETSPTPSEVVNGSANVSSSSENDAKKIPASAIKAATPFLSASILIAMDVGVRRLFRALSISFPSSLGGCCALFASMLLFTKNNGGLGPRVFLHLSPGAGLLAKWLPVFFVPSLITLPLAGSLGSPIEIAKIFAVVVGGFYFTLLTTAGAVVGVRKVFSSNSDDVMTAVTATDTTAEATTVVQSEKSTPPPSKPFSDRLVNGLRAVAIGAGIGSAVLARQAPSAASFLSNSPLTALFFLSATLHNFCFGARMPKKLTKIIHPLVICTSLTWMMAQGLAVATGSTFKAMLQGYKKGSLNIFAGSGGAGDVLLFLLGPAVISLAISMYDRRKLMQDNLKEVASAIGVSSVGGLVGTAAMVRLLQIANPALRLSLLSRNITSPLAMAIAGIFGADVSLAVSMVVVTGLIGANFGASILDAFGIKDAVARGLGIGAAAHGLGTAAFVGEKDAFPFAAIGMALTATACTCLVSIPSIKKVILQLALGL